VKRLDAVVTALESRVMQTEEYCETIIRDLERFDIALQKVLRQHGSYAAESGAQETTQAEQQEKKHADNPQSLSEQEQISQGLTAENATELRHGTHAADALITTGGETLPNGSPRHINQMGSQKANSDARNISEFCSHIDDSDCTVPEIRHAIRPNQGATAENAAQLRRGAKLREQEVPQAEIDQLAGRLGAVEERLAANISATRFAMKTWPALPAESGLKERLEALESAYASITTNFSLAGAGAIALPTAAAETLVPGPVAAACRIGGVSQSSPRPQDNRQPPPLQGSGKFIAISPDPSPRAMRATLQARATSAASPAPQVMIPAKPSTQPALSPTHRRPLGLGSCSAGNHSLSPTQTRRLGPGSCSAGDNSVSPTQTRRVGLSSCSAGNGSLSPTQRGPIGPGSCSERNHAAKQHQPLLQRQQQQRPANLAGLTRRQGSVHTLHHAMRVSTPGACGNSTLQDCAAVPDLQGVASLPGP